MGLEAGTSVVTPSVKPAKPETSLVKEEEMICVGPVMDSTGRMRQAFTDQDGNAQLKNDDALDDSLLAHRSLTAVAHDTSLDDKNICALKREQEGAVRRVTLNDEIDYGTTMAY